MSATAPLVPTTAPFDPADIDRLNNVIARSNGEQRAWLAGFLAGLQVGKTAVPQPSAPPRTAEPLTILYATESGNSERLAAAAQAQARRAGFKPKLLDMADAEPADLKSTKNLLVIAATWGEGEPPQRAIPFHRAFMGDAAPTLDGVKFSVLALGDRSYVNFCQTGREFDERLAALGGQRIAERVECDLDFEAPAADWTKKVLDALAPKGGGAEVIHVDFAPVPAEVAWTRTKPFTAEVGSAVVLNGSRSTKRTSHIELSLEGSGIAYEPGDALSVVPRNDPMLVEAVLSAAGVEPTRELEERLAADLEITAINKPLLESYQRLRPHDRLGELLAGDGWKAWAEGRHLIDALEAFPSKLAADELTGLMRQLPARAYSIASSPLAHPDEAHLLVGVVEYDSHGRPRQGVASSWLAGLKPGATAAVFLRPNRHFRLPADGDRPIVMIGPGTGVAPFRAFAQHRREQGAKGKSWLFFGDRSYTHDFLYQLEWQEALKDGSLSRIDLAFSRDQPEKVYVQDRMWEHRAELWRWLQEGAHLYVCGDATAMAKDVHATLGKIATDAGEKEPERFLDQLIRAGRYQRDTY